MYARSSDAGQNERKLQKSASNYLERLNAHRGHKHVPPALRIKHQRNAAHGIGERAVAKFEHRHVRLGREQELDFVLREVRKLDLRRKWSVNPADFRTPFTSPVLLSPCRLYPQCIRIGFLTPSQWIFKDSPEFRGLSTFYVQPYISEKLDTLP